MDQMLGSWGHLGRGKGLISRGWLATPVYLLLRLFVYYCFC